MLCKNDIRDIIDDITGTIILIVEDENIFNVNINRFFTDNFNLFTKDNLIDTTLEEAKKEIDLSKVIFNLIMNDFNVFDKLTKKDLSLSNIELKKYINRDLIIKIK